MHAHPVEWIPIDLGSHMDLGWAGKEHVRGLSVLWDQEAFRMGLNR